MVSHKQSSITSSRISSTLPYRTTGYLTRDWPIVPSASLPIGSHGCHSSHHWATHQPSDSAGSCAPVNRRGCHFAGRPPGLVHPPTSSSGRPRCSWTLPVARRACERLLGDRMLLRKRLKLVPGMSEL